MIRILAAAGALALALAGGLAAMTPASAQQNGVSRGDATERMERRFNHFDRNGDGYIDRGELEQQMTRAFQRFDRNGDGAIDRDEMSGRPGQRANADRLAKRLQRLDANRDGRVTQQEYLAKPPRWFVRGDADRDGRVSRQEFEDFMAAAAERRSKRMGRQKNDM